MASGRSNGGGGVDENAWREELTKIASGERGRESPYASPRESPYASPRSSLCGGDAKSSVQSSPRSSSGSVSGTLKMPSPSIVSNVSEAQARLEARAAEMARQRKMLLNPSPRSTQRGPSAAAPNSNQQRRAPANVYEGVQPALMLSGTGQISRNLPIKKRPLPEMEGWLEKRGQVFWNMRYRHPFIEFSLGPTYSDV